MVSPTRMSATGVDRSGAKRPLRALAMATSSNETSVAPAVGYFTRYIGGVSRRGQALVDLPGSPLDPVCQELAVLAHGPDRSAGHRDVLLVGLRAEETVVLSGQQPARGHTAAVGVLKRLDDLEVQVVDLRQEAGYPALEVLAARDGLTTGDDVEVVDDKSIDGRRVMGVPHLVPEGVHDIDGIRCTHDACNALRSAESPRSVASVAAGTTPA